MSRKANCWDNAVIERFFLSLKTERVWQRDYANHNEAMTDIANYIVGFYNSVRLHSKLSNLPPKPSSINRQSNNLSKCPKKLDHHNWMWSYNHERPNMALGSITPKQRLAMVA